MNFAFDFDAVTLPPEITQRIRDARNSGLSDCETSVLSLLVDLSSGPRAGRSKALQIAEMQAIWKRGGVHVWGDRSVKDAVKCLLEDNEIPIGSSRARGCSGYFVVLTDEDLKESERPIRGELLSLAKRLRALNPKSTFARELMGQLAMEAEQ